MHCTTNKKEIITKATVTIALDTQEEVQAFKNILSCGENEVYRLSHNHDFKLEKKILQQLKDSIG